MPFCQFRLHLFVLCMPENKRPSVYLQKQISALVSHELHICLAKIARILLKRIRSVWSSWEFRRCRAFLLSQSYPIVSFRSISTMLHSTFLYSGNSFFSCHICHCLCHSIRHLFIQRRRNDIICAQFFFWNHICNGIRCPYFHTFRDFLCSNC